jgi:hypothetical protein
VSKNCGNTSRVQAEKSGTRVTVILPDGLVVADSNEDPTIMEPHHQRVEVAAALQGETGKSLRYSRTIEEDMLYVAIPIYAGLTQTTSAGEHLYCKGSATHVCYRGCY